MSNRRIESPDNNSDIEIAPSGTKRVKVSKDGGLILGSENDEAKNVKIHRSGEKEIQFVEGDDSTAEGTPSSNEASVRLPINSVKSTNIDFGTGTSEVSAQDIPANISSSVKVTPRQEGSEGTDKVSAFLNGVVDALLKNKFDATAAPTVNDDSSTGYSVGSKWINTTSQNIYTCVDASVGAAVWKDITGLKISSNDTTPGYLEDKVQSANTKLGISTINEGGNEKTQFTVNEGNINHDSLNGFVLNEHRPLNDSATDTTSLWSASKIIDYVANNGGGMEIYGSGTITTSLYTVPSGMYAEYSAGDGGGSFKGVLASGSNIRWYIASNADLKVNGSIVFTTAAAGVSGGQYIVFQNS